MSFSVIGELLNTTRDPIRNAVARRQTGVIQKLVIRQQESGADYIDVNTGAGVQAEQAELHWLIDTVQAVATVPLCIDSPDPAVIASAWERLDRPPMINSITLEKTRFQPLLEQLQGRPCQVIALCLDDSGMPADVTETCRRAERLVTALTGRGIPLDAVWIDPLVSPVSTDTRNGPGALAAVAAVKQQCPGVKTVCGLSNISFGLPARRIINRTFLPLMISRGLNGALLDPLDRELTAALATTRMLLGDDAYCLGYMDHCAAEKVPG